MTKAGRLAYIKAVLNAIPIHQLLVLGPPKKTLNQLAKIERGFLWEGRREANGGSCHVNWSKVSRPLPYGGLGVRDLDRTGVALRVRWLWFSRTDDRRAWHGLDLRPSAKEQAIFFASTTVELGNGHNTLFWEDRWINGRAVREIAPQLYDCIPKRRRKQRTVAEGLAGNFWARDIRGTLGIHEVGQYLQIWQAIANTLLNDEPDRLRWMWTADGVYTAESCYMAMFHGSKLSEAWKLTWKTWAPPRVKFF